MQILKTVVFEKNSQKTRVNRGGGGNYGSHRVRVKIIDRTCPGGEGGPVKNAQVFGGGGVGPSLRRRVEFSRTFSPSPARRHGRGGERVLLNPIDYNFRLTSTTILPAGCPSMVMSKNTFGLAMID